MNRCFFIGHRDAEECVFSELRETVLNHAKEFGVREFIVGRYDNFDRMSARAVMEIKKENPDIRLTLLCPYHPGMRTAELPEEFDGRSILFINPCRCGWPLCWRMRRRSARAII